MNKDILKELPYVSRQELVDVRFCCDVILEKFISEMSDEYSNAGVGIGLSKKVGLASVGLYWKLVDIAFNRYGGRLVAVNDEAEYVNRINGGGNDIVRRLEIGMSRYICEKHFGEETS